MGCENSKYTNSPATVWCDHQKCCSSMGIQKEPQCCDENGCFDVERQPWNDNTSGITLNCPDGYTDEGIVPHIDEPGFTDSVVVKEKSYKIHTGMRHKQQNKEWTVVLENNPLEFRIVVIILVHTVCSVKIFSQAMIVTLIWMEIHIVTNFV